MKPEIVKPLMKIISEMIKNITGEEVVTGEKYNKNSPFSASQIAVIIGIAGKIKGQVVFSMDEKLGLYIASKMISFEEVTELNEYAKSALEELSNMVMGHVASFMSEVGYTTDITVPSVLTGDNMLFSVDKAEIHCIPVEFANGSIMEINFSYVET